jgi:superfamily II DNA/RNA helicase
MPREITELANSMLRDPMRVAVTPAATTVERIAQRVVFVDRGGKPGLLADLLRNEPVERALVFTRTKRGADRVVRDLGKQGLAAEAIHGNKSQGQRERVLLAFRNGKIRTLVATDIAARGIDVEGISHVINYDLPNIPESYVHRIGRTARAGADGVAISFCDGEERAYLRDIEKLIRMSIPASGQHGAHRSEPRTNGNPGAPRQHRGNGGGHRNGGRNNGQRRNGSQQPHRGKPAHRDERRDHAPRGPRPIAATTPVSDGSIGTVAFMRQKPDTGRPGDAL